MMNTTTNQPTVTVTKAAPWHVLVDGNPTSEVYTSRKAAREAAAKIRANGVDQPWDALTGAQLEAIRRARKVSLRALAEAMGVTAYKVWYTEKGKLEVTQDYVTAFDQALASV